MPIAEFLRRRGRALAILLALAAPAAAAAQPQPVAGMRVVLQPPEGFIPAPRFAGFQREEARASIMVTELEAPFSLMESRLTTQAFAREGMRMRSSEPFAVDSLRGRLIAVTQNAPDGVTYDKWVLMFGDDRFTSIVTGTYPAESAGALSEPLKQAVLTSRWGSGPPADPLEGLGFRVTPGPRLRIANRTGNAIALNESGSLPNPDPAAPFVVIGSSISEVDLTDVEAFARRRMGQIATISQTSNVTGGPVSIDGAAGYEMFADAVHAESSLPLRVYQVVLAEGRHYILIQGFVGADRAEDVIPEFQALARSLRRTR